MRRLARLAAILAAALCASGPALAQQLGGDLHTRAVDFVLANSRHVLYHEIGHMYVDLFDLPVLGKEEDAVDMLATVMMLSDGRNDAASGLADAADGWYYSERTRGTSYSEADFSGQHSLDIQRSFTITCLVVGSDFDAHSRFATRFGLSIDRQKGCEEDYILARDSWASVLSPHRRDDSPGEGIEIRYAPTVAYQWIAEFLRASRVLEGAAQQVSKFYALPEQATFLAQECGEVNAFYVPATREVILCYEWAEFYYDLFANHVLPDRLEAERRRGLKLDKISFG